MSRQYPLTGKPNSGVLVLQHQREEVLGKVEVFPSGDVFEDLRFQHIDAGVDGIGDHLAPARLLQKLGDAFFLVGDHHAELQRVLDRGQGDGGHCLVVVMKIHDLLEVEIGQQVAADYQESAHPGISRPP